MTWMWGVIVVAVIVGGAVGFLLSYLLGVRDRHAAKLEDELAHLKADFSDYRGKVDAHFVETSELFQDMTERYRAVYEHLATGARSLCSEGLRTQRLDVPESRPLIEPAAEQPEAESEPAPAKPQGAAPAPTAAEQQWPMPEAVEATEALSPEELAEELAEEGAAEDTGKGEVVQAPSERAGS